MRGARGYTTSHVWTPPGSVTRALGVQSRASWFFLKGLRSAPPSHAEPWKHQSVIFFFALLLHHHLHHTALQSCILRGSHGTTAVALEAFPFATTATESSAFECVHVRGFLCAIVGPRTQDLCSYELNIKTCGAISFLCILVFSLCCAEPLYRCHTVSQARCCGSHGTTAAALQGALSDSGAQCFCACVCAHVCSVQRNTIWTSSAQTSSEF